MNIVLLGGPGSGKGTASEGLEKIYNIAHISTGDMLREEIKKETPLGLEVKELMEEGKLVSDEIVTELLRNKLKSKDCENGAIFDGYPRNVAQAQTLTNILAELGKKIDIAIELDVDDEIIVERIVNRVSCPNKNCGAIYNTKFNPPKVENICDECGAELISRTDDNRETVKNRLNIYHEQSSAIIEYYKNEGVLYTLKPTADTKPEEILEQITEEIEVRC